MRVLDSASCLSSNLMGALTAFILITIRTRSSTPLESRHWLARECARQSSSNESFREQRGRGVGLCTRRPIGFCDNVKNKRHTTLACARFEGVLERFFGSLQCHGRATECGERLGPVFINECRPRSTQIPLSRGKWTKNIGERTETDACL